MPDNPVARIRHNLVTLCMPRALEALEGVIQQLERGQLGAIDAIDILLAEEITVREGRRIKAVLQIARLAHGQDPDRLRFLVPALPGPQPHHGPGQPRFVDRHEVVHFIGQSGTGKSHLAVALGVRGFAEWGQVFGDPVIATALLDQLLHHAVVVHIEGSSYRMRQHADLLPPVPPPGPVLRSNRSAAVARLKQLRARCKLPERIPAPRLFSVT